MHRAPGEPIRFVIIPDSFKGTLPARGVARAIARGVERAAADCSEAVSITELPFADGGEGTLDAVVASWGTAVRTCAVTDAIGRAARAEFALRAEGTIALVEAAQANGLAAVADAPLRPRESSTRGVGTLVRAALDCGVEEIILTVGGSATTDGGTGLLRELGARFENAAGAQLPDGGGSLADLARIDLAGVDPRVRAVRWRIATDVTNPLTGPCGAAHVFGPQKGATPDDVRQLERGLARLAAVVRSEGGREIEKVAGLGAAGGLAALLFAFFGAELVPGWQLVSEAMGAREIVGAADVVITAEGAFDAQSLDGKVVHGVRQLTPPGVPLIVLAGTVNVDAEAMSRSGVTAAFSILRGPATLAEIAPMTAQHVEWAANQIARLLLLT